MVLAVAMLTAGVGCKFDGAPTVEVKTSAAFLRVEEKGGDCFELHVLRDSQPLVAAASDTSTGQPTTAGVLRIVGDEAAAVVVAVLVPCK